MNERLEHPETIGVVHTQVTLIKNNQGRNTFCCYIKMTDCL